MLLDTLLARATGMPGFEFWRDLAPRRFLVDHLLADVIRATEVLPVSQGHGTFAVLSTSPLGLPETLPEGWSEVGRRGDHFAILRTPVGTSTRTVTETLALELIPLFYPSEVYEDKLFSWLEKELGPDQDEDEEGAFTGGPGPDAPGPGLMRAVRCIDIPSPSSYRRPKTEEEQDLDFLYGNGSTPPEYQGFDRDRLWLPRSECAGQLDPTYGPPEVSDQDIQAVEEMPFYFG